MNDEREHSPASALRCPKREHTHAREDASAQVGLGSNRNEQNMERKHMISVRRTGKRNLAIKKQGQTLFPPKAAPISAPLVPTFTFTMPASLPAGPIHLPTLRTSRVQRLLLRP